MPVAVKCVFVDETRKNRIRRYALTLSGSYTTGGDTVDFTGLSKNGFARAIPPSNPLPGNDNISFDGVPDGFDMMLVANGTAPTLKNYLLKVYSTADTEHTAGAYETNLKAVTVEIEIITPKY